MALEKKRKTVAQQLAEAAKAAREQRKKPGSGGKGKSQPIIEDEKGNLTRMTVRAEDTKEEIAERYLKLSREEAEREQRRQQRRQQEIKRRQQRGQGNPP